MALKNPDLEVELVNKELELAEINKQIVEARCTSSLSAFGRSITRQDLGKLVGERDKLLSEVAGIKNKICGGNSEFSSIKYIGFRR